MANDDGYSFRMTPRTADETHAYIHDQGWWCNGCDHRHVPTNRSGICIGCKCERTAPTVQDFEGMRMVDFERLYVMADEEVTGDDYNAADPDELKGDM